MAQSQQAFEAGTELKSNSVSHTKGWLRESSPLMIQVEILIWIGFWGRSQYWTQVVIEVQVLHPQPPGSGHSEIEILFPSAAFLLQSWDLSLSHVPLNAELLLLHQPPAPQCKTHATKWPHSQPAFSRQFVKVPFSVASHSTLVDSGLFL